MRSTWLSTHGLLRIFVQNVHDKTDNNLILLNPTTICKEYHHNHYSLYEVKLTAKQFSLNQILLMKLIRYLDEADIIVENLLYLTQ